MERQQEAVQKYEKENNIRIDRYFEDKKSGKDFDRPQYQAMKWTLREGDVLVIKELDRLGRNMEQIKREWFEIQEMGVDIVVIDTPILNTNHKSDLEKKLISNIVFELLSYMAEKERTKIKQRQEEGIAVAKAKGKHLGRPKKDKPENWDEVYAIWKENKISAVRAMELLGCPSTTFYRWVKDDL